MAFFAWLCLSVGVGDLLSPHHLAHMWQMCRSRMPTETSLQAPAGMHQRGLRARGIDLNTEDQPPSSLEGAVLLGSREQRSKYLKLRSLLKSILTGQRALATCPRRSHVRVNRHLTVLLSLLPLPIP